MSRRSDLLLRIIPAPLTMAASLMCFALVRKTWNELMQAISTDNNSAKVILILLLASVLCAVWSLRLVAEVIREEVTIIRSARALNDKQKQA